MTSWKDRKRGHWRYRFQYQGADYYGKGYPTRRESDAAEAEHRKTLKAARKATPSGMGFVYAVNTYLDYAERKFAPKTYKYKRFVYQSFLDQYGDIFLQEITPRHIHEYLNSLKSNNLYNVHRKDLSSLFAFAIKQLSVEIQNPCAAVGKMPHSPKKKDIPSEEEILRLIVAATPGDEKDIFLCCLHTLGRIDEVLRMAWEDVNLDKRIITLWTRKRKGGAYEADPLPMNQDLYEILKRRWDEKIQGKWIFYNEDTGTRFMHRPKMMAGLCKRAGIEPIGKGQRKLTKGKKKGQTVESNHYYGFHSLRHFMASYLADQERVGTQAVSKLLRHKNLRTTEIYLHSLDESQRLAMEKIEGKFTSKNENPLTTPSHKEKQVINEKR
ncbi:MAG: tyrosine-type recombinase/integrase [Smithella sp.]|jgi:integrase